MKNKLSQMKKIFVELNMMEYLVAWYMAKSVSEENNFTLKGQHWGRLKEQMGERISESKRQEAMGSSVKLNNEDPGNLQFSSNITTLIMSRRVVWTFMWCALKRWEFYRELYWKLRVQIRLRCLIVDRRMKLKSVVKYDVMICTDICNLKYEQMDYFYYVNKLGLSYREGDFLTNWATTAFRRRNLLNGAKPHRETNFTVD
jgi:hypothetical protein